LTLNSLLSAWVHVCIPLSHHDLITLIQIWQTECNKRGIQYRLNALRKQDKEQPSPTKGGFTPINSPAKRKAGRPPRTPAKKQKNQDNDDETDDELLGVVVQGDHHDGN
jgi:hypothetical protein